MEAVVPTGLTTPPESTAAIREDGLLERSWGFIDTTKANAHIFIEELTKLVAERFGSPSTVVEKMRPGVGISDGEEELLFRNGGPVLAVFGDCGTSASFSVRDAARMERRGIPSAAVLSGPFVAGGHELAASLGVPDLPIIEIPHPLAALSVDDVRSRANDAMDVIESVFARIDVAA
jgi:hypothetical protein